MPYIPHDIRYKQYPLTTPDEKISRHEIGELLGDFSHNGGDLQYMLAVAINYYLEKKGLNYQNCQDIMGALTGALGEFQRVVVGPYEQSKIEENGEVYTVQKKPLDEKKPDEPESMKAAKELLTLVFGDTSHWSYGNVMVGVDELWVCIRPNIYIDKTRIPKEYKGFKVIIKENWEVIPA